MPKHKKSYKDRVKKFVKHSKLTIIPAPDRVLVRITKQQIEDLISKVITKDDGTKAGLFFEPIHFDEGYERRFQQNVSVAEALSVGSDVGIVRKGDTVILDYLAMNLSDETIGHLNGDQMICMKAETTYHETSAVSINGRRAWVKGDIDYMSRILGVVRGDRLIPIDPYIFIEYQSDYLKMLNAHGEAVRSTIPVIKRTVIAAPPGCDYECGDEIYLKKDDWFDREVGGKTIAILFKQDILGKVYGGKILSEQAD